MKESITKFDLESAFKALDEIDVPVAEAGIRANRPALTEIFSRKSKFDCLMEEYYDINSNDGLEDAKAARDAEIAAAKLARIEKIVDLDAESADDLLPSYVGKFIIQCPQCMTLFYKNEEDVVASEEDPTTVNVNEVCQHCGNESGYTLIGKVGAANEEPVAEEESAEEETPTAEDEAGLEDLESLETEGEDGASEGESEETAESGSTDDSLEDLNFDAELEEIELADIEDDEEEEKKEESFSATFGQPLNEELTEDVDTDISDAEFEQLLKSSEFKKPISDRAVRAMLDMEADKEPEDTAKEESLDNIFSDVEELQEADLEHMISDSLVEMYGNVAGFRLKDCSYEDNKFMVEGVIHFTSGNTRKTTYAFDEALVEASKVTLRGLNEKLGLDKQFFIVGRTENKTLITESFKVAKN